METIKEVRSKAGLKQKDVADKLGLSVMSYSNYETGKIPFPVEDCVILENNFREAMQWDDDIPIDAKQNLIRAFNVLSERYPLKSVLSFLQKSIKAKGEKPDRLAMHFTGQMKSTEGPMLPPNIKNNEP